MTNNSAAVSAQINAKINIGLQIVCKRADGYHDLQTIFYPTNFFSDFITIARCDEDLVFSIESNECLGEKENNLCVKAFRILQKAYGISGANICLRKGIPSGAGLGGGSADAAFTLKILNLIFSLNIPDGQLSEFALQLGSDVPFFLKNEPVYATCRGEIMTPINLNLSQYRLKIVKPAIQISTKEAYAGVTPKKTGVFLPDVVKLPVSEWKNLVKNDFEESLFEKYPELRRIKDQFYSEGAEYASLSGSGSAIFGLFRK